MMASIIQNSNGEEEENKQQEHQYCQIQSDSNTREGGGLSRASEQESPENERMSNTIKKRGRKKGMEKELKGLLTQYENMQQKPKWAGQVVLTPSQVNQNTSPSSGDKRLEDLVKLQEPSSSQGITTTSVLPERPRISTRYNGNVPYSLQDEHFIIIDDKNQMSAEEERMLKMAIKNSLAEQKSKMVKTQSINDTSAIKDPQSSVKKRKDLRTLIKKDSQIQANFEPEGPAHLNSVPLSCTHIVQDKEKPQVKEYVENMRAVARDYPQNLVGMIVFIYWPNDDVWFRAKIISFIEKKLKFKIIYDNKNEELIDLANEYFVVEDDRLKEMAAERKKFLKLHGLDQSYQQVPLTYYSRRKQQAISHGLNLGSEEEKQDSQRNRVKKAYKKGLKFALRYKNKQKNKKNAGMVQIIPSKDSKGGNQKQKKVLGKRNSKNLSLQMRRKVNENVKISHALENLVQPSESNSSSNNVIRLQTGQTTQKYISSHSIGKTFHLSIRQLKSNSIKIDLSPFRNKQSTLGNTSQVRGKNQEQQLKNNNDLIKLQLNQMNLKEIDGFKVYHIDFSNVTGQENQAEKMIKPGKVQQILGPQNEVQTSNLPLQIPGRVVQSQMDLGVQQQFITPATAPQYPIITPYSNIYGPQTAYNYGSNGFALQYPQMMPPHPTQFQSQEEYMAYINYMNQSYMAHWQQFMYSGQYPAMMHQYPPQMNKMNQKRQQVQEFQSHGGDQDLAQVVAEISAIVDRRKMRNGAGMRKMESTNIERINTEGNGRIQGQREGDNLQGQEESQSQDQQANQFKRTKIPTQLVQNLSQNVQIKGLMSVRLDHTRQTVQILNDSPRELLKSIEEQILNKFKINPSDFTDPVSQHENIEACVTDTLKNFYNIHDVNGYKACTCSSCKRLRYPILIKNYKDSKEYEEFHASYLAMMQFQNVDGDEQKTPVVEDKQRKKRVNRYKNDSSDESSSCSPSKHDENSDDFSDERKVGINRNFSNNRRHQSKCQTSKIIIRCSTKDLSKTAPLGGLSKLSDEQNNLPISQMSKLSLKKDEQTSKKSSRWDVHRFDGEGERLKVRDLNGQVFHSIDDLVKNFLDPLSETLWGIKGVYFVKENNKNLTVKCKICSNFQLWFGKDVIKLSRIISYYHISKEHEMQKVKPLLDKYY